MKNYVKRVILFWFCMVFYMLVQAQVRENRITGHVYDCLLYTSDAADD